MPDNKPPRLDELTADRLAKVQAALAALKELSAYERGFVFCWFCPTCHRFVGPGETCQCKPSV